MYTIGQKIYHTGSYPIIPITEHTIEKKMKVVDSDGKEQVLYWIPPYKVWFPEQELVEKFSVVCEE